MDSEEDAKDTLFDLRVKKRTFRGQPVKGGLKSVSMVRSFFPVQAAPVMPAAVYPGMPYPHPQFIGGVGPMPPNMDMRYAYGIIPGTVNAGIGGMTGPGDDMLLRISSNNDAMNGQMNNGVEGIKRDNSNNSSNSSSGGNNNNNSGNSNSGVNNSNGAGGRGERRTTAQTSPNSSKGINSTGVSSNGGAQRDSRDRKVGPPIYFIFHFYYQIIS